MDQWYAVLPPSRPTNVELQRVSTRLSSIEKSQPIAVLGSTPEFRELLFRMGFSNRFVFDRSSTFYERMGKLIPNSVAIGEKLIIGDWLDSLPHWKNCFSMVLSDLTMGNISYSRRDAFYSSISNSLVDGGVFVDKVLAFDFEIPTLDELFEKYENLPLNLRTINDFSSEVLFCSELVMRKKLVDSTEFYKLIREGPYSEKIKYFADAAHIITPEGFTWDYGIPWSELSPDYSKYYSSQVVYCEEDPASPYFHRTKQIFSRK